MTKISKKTLIIILACALAVVCAAVVTVVVLTTRDKGGEPPIGREEYEDIIGEATRFTVTAPSGEGYTVIAPDDILEGETLTFTVNINGGYTADTAVVRANGNALTGNGGTYTVADVSENITITVENVTRAYYLVSYELPYGVSVAGAETVVPGSDLSFTVSVSENAEKTDDFAVIANGSELQPVSEGNYTVAAVSADLHISVIGVTAESYTVTASQGEGYEVRMSAERVYKGQDLYFSVNLFDGYKRGSNVSVEVNGELCLADEMGVYSVANVSQNLTVSVSGVTEDTAYTVKFENIDTAHTQQVYYGETANLNFVPVFENRVFNCWTVDGEKVDAANYTITEDTVFVANWYAYANAQGAEESIVYEWTAEDVANTGSGYSTAMDGTYSQAPAWKEGFRIQNFGAGAVFNITFPLIDYSRTGLVAFKFSISWGGKNLQYNGTTIGGTSNGGNFDNFAEFIIGDGYIACNGNKVALAQDVYEGKEPLVLSVDNGTGLNAVFSDLYTYLYDYADFLKELTETDADTAIREEIESLLATYGNVASNITDYEMTAYGVAQKIRELRVAYGPQELCTDGSLLSVSGAGNIMNANDTNVFSEGANRWTVTNYTAFSISLEKMAIGSDECVTFQIGFQGVNFPVSIKLGEDLLFTANTSLERITIKVYGDGTLTAEGSNGTQGEDGVAVSAGVLDSSESLTLDIFTNTGSWMNFNVCKTITLEVVAGE